MLLGNPVTMGPWDYPDLPRKIKGPKKQLNLLFPEALVQEIDHVAKQHGLSRTEVLIYGMTWVCERMRAAAPGGRGPGGSPSTTD